MIAFPVDLSQLDRIVVLTCEFLCMVCLHMFLWMHVHMVVEAGGQRQVYSSPQFEIGCLIELRAHWLARLSANEPLGSPVSTPLSAVDYRAIAFYVALERSELKSSCVSSRHFTS